MFNANLTNIVKRGEGRGGVGHGDCGGEGDRRGRKRPDGVGDRAGGRSRGLRRLAPRLRPRRPPPGGESHRCLRPAPRLQGSALPGDRHIYFLFFFFEIK